MSPAAQSFGLGRSQPPPNSAATSVEPSTPWMAASEGNLSLLQSSLSALNSPATIADANGYTLLHAASSYRRLSIIQWLLEPPQSLPINTVDGDGDSALHHTEHQDVAKLLIEKGGANPSLCNTSGKTPLQVKQEELDELMVEEDDDEEIKAVRDLIEYLTIAVNSPPQ